MRERSKVKSVWHRLTILTEPVLKPFLTPRRNCQIVNIIIQIRGICLKAQSISWKIKIGLQILDQVLFLTNTWIAPNKIKSVPKGCNCGINCTRQRTFIELTARNDTIKNRNTMSENFKPLC